MAHNSYLFVFNRSFEKTDISKGELISLLELQQKDVLIRTKTVEELTSEGNRISFNNQIFVDENKDFTYIIFLSQSAIVLSSFKFDIKDIIRRSGYIHSCGKFLFISKWADLQIDDILEDVTSFCKKENEWHNTVFYKKTENEVNNKLDSLLIDDRRYHIGNDSFNIASNNLQSKLNSVESSLKLKPNEEHIFIFLEKGKVHDYSALSELYEDRNVIDYGVCYLSEYKKDNPIHEMDNLKELKPFWAGIFTTPHRLMNAMLNIAKVEKDSIVLDPFCHTGTLAIEASQMGCKVIASDLFGTNGAKDNYDFFCNGAQNFNSIIGEITEHLNNVTLTKQFQALIPENIKLNAQGLPETTGDVNDRIKSLSERLYYYILRRYSMENLRGAELGVEGQRDFVNNYIRPFQEDKYEPGFSMFGKQLELFENEFAITGEPIVSFDNNNKKYFTDSYYTSKRVGYINNCFRTDYPIFLKNNICGNIESYGIEESSINAVVTDPPYGYGEGLEMNEVRDIYSSLIDKSITWLKSGGYLVFCALDKVKTGRTRDLLFTEDILDIVNIVAKRRKVNFIMHDILLTSDHLKNVYYWKSNYALNRTIISVQIIK
ncbi:site-specific DNA-methyltransferase [Draconibacterium sediminis]|uniref:Ribosomal RNA large subunit methyltransferase K/L-like methyltransferase domain-containing protein n=1 Tax=Draconibacterium sediminis TaxID=1544798 RepID=A0A0D8J7R2_9BACT|nr:site-specific DNA-methyltransferase [Draconibacterium sediminis]KJF41833.1 hypothetical protein LH29_23125 [Draconibacterium sediminis]